jgi:uncharacterized protein (DUF1330 family)
VPEAYRPVPESATLSGCHGKQRLFEQANKTVLSIVSVDLFPARHHRTHDRLRHQRDHHQRSRAVQNLRRRDAIHAETPEAISGAIPSPRVVIVQFPDVEKAKAWRNSPAYAELLVIRDGASTSRVYVIDGV